jgi:hypothetical protein
MRYYLVSLFCLINVFSFSQTKIDVDKTQGLPQNSFFSVGGEPFVNVKFVRLISGSPYFKDEWMRGSGVSGTGIVYKAGILKLDLFDHQIHFLDAFGKEMISTSPLKQLVLTDTLTNQSWQFIHSSLFIQSAVMKPGWYLQLASGTAGLYQYFFKSLSESTPYGSATTEQTIITKEEFYIYHNSSLQQVKKVKDVFPILHDKQTELEKFSKNNSKGKLLEEQLTSLVQLYNEQ